MAKNDKKNVRTAYIKDLEKSVEGFDTFEAANEAAGKIPESDSVRVRVRFRSRTGKYDVLVKNKTELKIVDPVIADKVDEVLGVG